MDVLFVHHGFIMRLCYMKLRARSSDQYRDILLRDMIYALDHVMKISVRQDFNHAVVTLH